MIGTDIKMIMIWFTSTATKKTNTRKIFTRKICNPGAPLITADIIGEIPRLETNLTGTTAVDHRRKWAAFRY